MGTRCTCAIMAMARIVVIQVILQAILAVETSNNRNDKSIYFRSNSIHNSSAGNHQAVIIRDVTVALIASLSIIMRNSKQQHHYI